MENKEKIKRLRANIKALEEAKKSGTCDTNCRKELDAKIATLNAEIKKITDVGNGDGSGRKPIGAASTVTDPTTYTGKPK